MGVFAGALAGVPMSRAREIAAELESFGFGAIWFPESNARETFANLALLLDSTERMIGGTAIASIYARDPLAMACGAKTLTEAFPNRFLLGLGVSHQWLVEGMRGHEYRSPLATMRDYLDAMHEATYAAVEPSNPAATTPLRARAEDAGARRCRVPAGPSPTWRRPSTRR